MSTRVLAETTSHTMVTWENRWKMKIPKRKLFLLIIFAYVAFSLYAAYNVFFSNKTISRVHRVVKNSGAPAGKPTPSSFRPPSITSHSLTESVLCFQAESGAARRRSWRMSGTRGRMRRWSTTLLWTRRERPSNSTWVKSRRTNPKNIRSRSGAKLQ